MATFEKCLTEMQEVNQTLVLRVVLTTVASLQPYTALTVVLTAVDNSTGEENRTSPSVSSEFPTAQIAISHINVCMLMKGI